MLWFIDIVVIIVLLFYYCILFSLASLTSIVVKIKEIEEGDETEAFWNALGDEEDYMSYMEGSRRMSYDCFLQLGLTCFKATRTSERHYF